MRPAHMIGTFYCSGFNPRICKRCDDTVFGYQRPWYVSIHASVKDATER